ncbi:MAG: beta-hydroxyacyl-ACP dehydratase [Planctomycetota bacterium]|nr:beta-hydroxyacyl-ACP dehydratase [Planctomycetota bacterium]
MPPRPLFDLSTIDPDKVLYDIETIRASNPQRFEFEQLSWICHFDLESGTVAGVLEIPEQPWWAAGHVPDRPLMPGVLMLEAAAQLCSWCVHQVFDDDSKAGRIFGFGGIDGVKFRNPVFPPSRLLIIGKKAEIRPRRAVFDTQSFVDGGMACQARITGMWV